MESGKYPVTPLFLGFNSNLTALLGTFTPAVVTDSVLIVPPLEL